MNLHDMYTKYPLLRYCHIMLAAIIVAAMNCIPSHAKKATRNVQDNDTIATALYNRMRGKFNTKDQIEFYSLADKYRAHCLKTGHMHRYYNGWQAEIMYDINFNHFYRAMKKTLKMSKDIKERKCTDELYNASYLIGVIYSLQGNTGLAKKYFHKAINKAGTGDSLKTLHIYKDLANVEMDDEPDKAMAHIDRIIRITKASDLKYEYCDAIAFKVVLGFVMHDWNTVRKYYDVYMKIRDEHRKDFSTTYYTYVQICKHAADKEWDKAIYLTDRLTNIDKYKFKADIYEISGNMKAACKAQKDYIHHKDSVNSTIMVQELTNATYEIESIFTHIRKEEAKVMRIALVLTIFMALVIIAALIFVIRNRNRYLRELWNKNNELERLRSKAEEAEIMKESILKNMSHEVRTPLNIIAGFTQILGQSDANLSPEEWKDIAARVTESSNNIVKIINDLLYISSKDSINYTMRNDKVDCDELCSRCMEKFCDAKADGVKMTLNSSLPGGMRIRTNEDGLSRIMECLLDNACKFTEHGSIRINCRLTDNSRNVEISITDTGCGIPEEIGDKVFDPFYKTDTDVDGLGIGLILAQRIACQLDGNITLDRDYHDGARFILTIPVGKE